MYGGIYDNYFRKKNLRLFRVTGSESPPETPSSSSAVGPSTDIGASNNIALSALQYDVCSRLENEVGFKLKNAIDDKSLLFWLSKIKVLNTLKLCTEPFFMV